MKTKPERPLKCFVPEPHIFGEKTQCPRCRRNHIVHYGYDRKENPTKTLAFVICKGRSYLVAINGRTL